LVKPFLCPFFAFACALFLLAKIHLTLFGFIFDPARVKNHVPFFCLWKIFRAVSSINFLVPWQTKIMCPFFACEFFQGCACQGKKSCALFLLAKIKTDLETVSQGHFDH
jgi:hypothetical protein